MNLLNKLFYSNKKGKEASIYALDGEVCRLKGKYKEAIKKFNKAIEIEVNNDMFYASRSLAKKELKDYKGALKDIERAISLQPEVNKYQQIQKELSFFTE